MKNKLSDLNNHLFAQLERLSEETLEGEKLEAEMQRSKAVSQIAKDIVANARLVLDAEIAKGKGSLVEATNLVGIENTGAKR